MNATLLLRAVSGRTFKCPPAFAITFSSVEQYQLWYLFALRTHNEMKIKNSNLNTEKMALKEPFSKSALFASFRRSYSSESDLIFSPISGLPRSCKNKRFRSAVINLVLFTSNLGLMSTRNTKWIIVPILEWTLVLISSLANNRKFEYRSMNSTILAFEQE